MRDEWDEDARAVIKIGTLEAVQVTVKVHVCVAGACSTPSASQRPIDCELPTTDDPGGIVQLSPQESESETDALTLLGDVAW